MKRTYLLAWILCFIMFLRCGWQGEFAMAGVYVVLMFLCSGLNDLAHRIDDIVQTHAHASTRSTSTTGAEIASGVTGSTSQNAASIPSSH